MKASIIMWIGSMNKSTAIALQFLEEKLYLSSGSMKSGIAFQTPPNCNIDILQ